MTCIKVMSLYGYLKHKRLALLDLNPAVRDNRLILRVNFGFHAPRDAASGGQSARHRHQPTGNAILFAERLHLHGGIGGVEGEHLIRLFSRITPEKRSRSTRPDARSSDRTCSHTRAFSRYSCGCAPRHRTHSISVPIKASRTR